MTDETMTAAEAARELGIGHNRVLILLREGKLAGYRTHGVRTTWRVDRASVERRRERTAAYRALTGGAQ